MSLSGVPDTTTGSSPGSTSGLETVGPERAPLPTYSEIPKIGVTTKRAGLAPGYLFLSPQSMREPEKARGPQIVDNEGRVVWFHALPEGQYATNVQVQRYKGEPVITWWQGAANNVGVGQGACYIVDTSYRHVATVHAGGEHGVDLHEFRLTDRGTALLVSYHIIPYDLTPIGGGPEDMTIDSVVEEVDVETGEVLLHWSGLENIPLNESDMPPGLMSPYDHLHVNAVAIDDDENLVITARSNSAVYKVDRDTGDVLWKLGSGASTFVLDVGVRSNWIHDGQAEGDRVYRVFDNGANDYFEGYESRVVWIHADEDTGIATFVKQITHPEHLSSLAEGNAQQLANGNVMVGWGRAARVSEFSSDGDLLFDATTPSGLGWTTYRCFRLEWDGRPDTPPEIVTDADELHAVWNGATGVARWQLSTGGTEDDLQVVRTVDWNGLDTVVASLSELASSDVAKVAALDADGQVMAESPVEKLAAQ